MLSSYSWIVQCCVCVSSRPVTCLMTVPVSACQRINLPDNSQLTAFSPPLSFPIIPEYISEGNIFSTRTPCEVKYIFFSTHPQIGTKDSYFLVGNLCSAPLYQMPADVWQVLEYAGNRNKLSADRNLPKSLLHAIKEPTSISCTMSSTCACHLRFLPLSIALQFIQFICTMRKPRRLFSFVMLDK